MTSATDAKWPIGNLAGRVCDTGESTEPEYRGWAFSLTKYLWGLGNFFSSSIIPIRQVQVTLLTRS